MNRHGFYYQGFLNLTGILGFLALASSLVPKECLKVYKYCSMIISFQFNDVYWGSITFLILLMMCVNSFLLRRWKRSVYERKKKDIANVTYTGKNNYLQIFNILSLLMCFIVISYMIIYKIHDFFVESWISVIFIEYILKIASFNSVLSNLEKADKRGKETELKADEKDCEIFYYLNSKGTLDFKHFLYFLIIPDLIYSDKFIMKKSRNRRNILFCVSKLIVTTLVFIFVKNQFALPLLRELTATNNMIKLIKLYGYFVLSICVSWILLFYSYFNCYLKIFSELCKVNDLKIYGPWWNSTNLAHFWREWNHIFHKWMVKTIYKPLLMRKYSKFTAKLICFFVSGSLHEYAFFLVCKKFGGWMLFAFIMQVPSIYISVKIDKIFPKIGNFLFWIVFCVFGQPICVLLYYKIYISE
ncbi:hypothetical protein EDEG_02849 [Edhazardia aedis USNM 41457]|uniref:O-acyltransferase n=1 Tax=Edhazardia aedis (strain USNM 41457) TaxID=1003232 RepID=J9D4M3_EDHAE|nr:hypothetical protein EDEG_02849 [Edhazardia aedis USNM 41457]|eukprot:EJW02756.1 hypothetical protein EDEG_02849 [Edhazardia aedis USNM 41457]